MTSFYDSFTRADSGTLGTSDSGAAWTTLGGTFGILSNKARNSGGALSHATVDLGMSDCVVRWQLTTQQNASAVLLRCTNVNNLFYIRNNNGTNYALAKIVAGVFTQLITGGHPANGDYLTVRCEGPVITLYVNGVLTFTYSDSFNQTETHFGLRCSDVNTRYASMAAQALAAAGSTWHVKTTGTYFGDGSNALPWDIRTGLANVNGIVQPGDTIYVHSGDHGTSGDPVIQVSIGSVAGPAINVRRVPGEGWPKCYLGLSLVPGHCAGYVNFWGIQFLQDNVDRTNNYRGDNPTYYTGGVVLEAPYCEFHYCINANVASTNSAYFFGQQAVGSRTHMCLNYYGGFRDVFNGLPAGQAYYRQCDDGGTGIFQYIDTCISALHYQSGMQIQGGAAAQFRYGKTLRSLFFYGGYLGSSYAGGQAIREILLGSSSASPAIHADQMYFDEVWCWPQPGSTHQQAVQLGYNNPDNTFVSWTNSFIQGYLTLKLFRTAEFYGNWQARETLNGKVFDLLTTPTIGHIPTPAGLGIDHNTYLQTNDGNAGVGHFPFQYDDGTLNHEYKTVPLWNAGTGYDANSTLATYASATIQVGVYPNTYEPGEEFPTPRAFVYVFDPQSVGTATLDVSACTNIGSTWALYDWGTYEQDNPTPVATGTYNGTPITISLGSQTMPTLIADPTGPRSQNDGVPTIPPGQPSAYIYAITGSAVPVTPIDTENPTGLWVIFHAYAITQGGMVPGDRYYVCHSADILPEKYGRQALQAGIWQGGDIQCYIADAYPNADGPFYLLKTGFTGCHWTSPYEEPLHHDAVLRAAS